MMTGETALVARFAPTWEQIEPLRLFVETFARTRLGGAPPPHAGMATSELLENAVKYGDIIRDIEIEVRYRDETNELIVAVSNYAQAARIRILEKEFAGCSGDQAVEAFARAVGRLQRLPEGTSMLGLARIAAAVELDLRVDGGRVMVTALIGRTRVRSGYVRRNTSSVLVGGR